MFDGIIDKQPALMIPILAILSMGVVFLVWVLAHYYFKVRQMEAERTLKQDMLARDFSPADIERVMLASSSQRAEPPSRGKGAISDNEYYLVEKMLDEEHPIEEIERLVCAFKAGKAVGPHGERVMV